MSFSSNFPVPVTDYEAEVILYRFNGKAAVVLAEKKNTIYRIVKAVNLPIMLQSIF